MTQEYPMISLQGFILILFSAFLAGPAGGPAAECDFIKDQDRRNFCRALSAKDPSFCEFIKAPDLRHECRALAGKKKRQC